VSAHIPIDDLFYARLTYPDPSQKGRYEQLVGIDEQKTRLTKILSLLINPAGLKRWLRENHPNADTALPLIRRRTPLIVLAGDVGAGKTELAETIGDPVARQEKTEIMLYPLSLSTRGRGHVGEMTQLLAAAFAHVTAEGKKLKSADGAARGGIILLIDEADALAQSREAHQMHHEDRAGVNALIHGISAIANAEVPIAVIMCTNRAGALDPAVKRRAADILEFGRPNDEQRRAVLRQPLAALGFSAFQITKVVELTGPTHDRTYGFTFSDLTQRLLPTIILDAYPHGPVKASHAIELVKGILPTPPFQERTP
jgi:AAA+ superfamily predicted ATPase